MKMQELQQSPETAGWLAALLYKLLPGAAGAAVMICVDPPNNKRELFARLFVAFMCSYFLGDVVFEMVKTNIGWFAFLNPFKRAHTVSVDFVVGGCGWFVVGAAAMVLKKLRSGQIITIKGA
jgi:hypothetical protein